MKYRHMFATLIFCLITFNSFARSTNNAVVVKHQGIYLNGGFGIGSISCISCDIDHHTVTHTHSAHVIDLGYQFNPYVALELGASILQPFAYDTIIVPGLTTTPTSQEADIAMKAMLPLMDRFVLFGKLGDGMIWLPNRTDEKTAFSHKSVYFAVGIALYTTNRMTTEISYHHYAAHQLVIDSGIVGANILF